MKVGTIVVNKANGQVRMVVSKVGNMFGLADYARMMTEEEINKYFDVQGAKKKVTKKKVSKK